jgi:putative membrane protein
MNLQKGTVFAFLVSAAAVIYTTALVAFSDVQLAPFVVPLVTLLSFTFAVLHGSEHFGWKRNLLLLGLTFTVSLFFECIGVATGKVYGPYHYTDLLGPKFLGLVPLIIPAAWFMMTYPSFVIATRLIPEQWKGAPRLVGIAAVGALVMTAWDLAMDPLMVAGGNWVWDVKGAYFGVPLQNYWGWWLTTFVTFALFLLLGRVSLVRQNIWSDNFDQLAVASYIIVGLSSIITVTRIGLGGAGLAGLFAMLPWVIMGWKNRQL